MEILACPALYWLQMWEQCKGHHTAWEQLTSFKINIKHMKWDLSQATDSKLQSHPRSCGRKYTSDFFAPLLVRLKIVKSFCLCHATLSYYEP